MGLVLLSGGVGGMVVPAAATPPQDLTAYYHPKKHVLRVVIKHTTRDRDRHYIRRLSVYKNGQWLRTFAYTRQPTRYAFHYDLDIEAQEGDVLKVVAYCSKGGTKSTEVTVSEDIPSEWADEESQGGNNDRHDEEHNEQPIPTYYFDLRTGERIPARQKPRGY